MSADHGPEPVGSLAEETAKLLGALSGWGRDRGGDRSGATASATRPVLDGFHDHLATGSPECSWCPVCRVASSVRKTSPEVRAHLSHAATSLLLAVSGIMSTPVPSREGDVERNDLDGGFDDRPDDRPEDVT